MEETTAQTENQTAQPTTPTTTVPNVEPVKNTPPPVMPRKTLILIVILSVITVILLGLALYIGLPQVKPGQKQVKVLKTILSVTKPVASNSAYLANVTLTTERKKTTVVQIELTYDPKALTNVDINAGAFFPSPTILEKKIDAVNGRVSYILGIGLGQYPVNGNGTVAILSFTPLVKNGITTITFLPKSEVVVAGVIPSVLTNAQGVKFSFGETLTP